MVLWLSLVGLFCHVPVVLCSYGGACYLVVTTATTEDISGVPILSNLEYRIFGCGSFNNNFQQSEGMQEEASAFSGFMSTVQNTKN